ncbi:MAG: DMT family transporter [Chloroflexota bacterium]
MGMNHLYRYIPAGMLVLVTAVWGWTFVVVRDAVGQYPVLPFLAIRFGLAGLLLFPVAMRAGQGLFFGLWPGLALAAGYGFQTWGLQHTTASKAGLLTGLMVVMTPLLEWKVVGKRPPAWTLVAVGAAFIGTALLAGGGAGLAVKREELFGDGLEVLTALCFAVHVILLSRVPAGSTTARVALSQMLVAAVLFTTLSAVRGGIPLPTAQIWIALVITAGLASAVAFWIQTFVQQRLTPSRTAIVLVLEPAFATLFGVLLAGDRFSALQALGAGIILIALVAHEVVPALTRDSAPQSAGS